MVRLVFELDAPTNSAEWVKEHLSMYLERWGDIRLVDVQEVLPQQMEIGESKNKQ